MTEQREPVREDTASRAYRQLIARCRRVEADNRALRARLAEQPAQGDRKADGE